MSMRVSYNYKKVRRGRFRGQNHRIRGKMPHPKYQAAHADAAKLYNQRFRLGEIMAKLEQKYDQSPDRETVKTWLARFRKSLEDVVDWHLFEKSTGLPTEAQPIALEAWAQAGWPPQFTVRDARWAWKIRQAAPEAPRHIIVMIADTFANRERLRNLGTNPTADESDQDLWAFLASRFWEGDQEARRYREAIKVGWVSPFHGVIKPRGISSQESIGSPKVAAEGLVEKEEDKNGQG